MKGKSCGSTAPLPGQGILGGGAEPSKVLEGLLTVGKEAAEGFPIDGISLGGTWHSLLLADRAGRPKTDCYTWAYTGAADTAARFRQDEGENSAVLPQNRLYDPLHLPLF